MSNDPLAELVQFLAPGARIDLRHIAVDHLVGVSGTDEGICTLLLNEKVVKSIVDLTDDRVDEIAKSSLLILINITASKNGARELIKYKPSTHKNIVELLISYVLNSQKKHADAACMILCNITRLEEELDECLESFIPHLNDILNAFVNIEYNKTGSNLNYLAPMFSNLSQSSRVQKWLTEENPYLPLLKLLPFCGYTQSYIRRGGVIGALKNLSFATELHEFLLNPDIDLLTYILNPLMGNEDYPDDEMDKLPIALQYLPKEKVREEDPDIRKIILETLNRLCTKRKSREVLRENGVYYVLREYHKWEKDPQAILACENVVDILIRKEDEIGLDDIASVEVPQDMVEKFNQMDQEFIKNVE